MSRRAQPLARTCLQAVLAHAFLLTPFFAILSIAPAAAQERGAKRTAAPGAASVYFIEPKHGATVQSPVMIRFGLKGMGVAPAGIEKAGTGHHHLLVDVGVPLLDQPIPNDPQHIHFGAGQTEAEIALPPGEHMLQLLLGDHDHFAHNPPVISERVRVIVAPEQQQAAVAAAPAGASVRKRSPLGARVFFVYPRDGDYIYPTSTIRFGLSEMGVAPAGINKAGTGHHHLLINADEPRLDGEVPNDPKHLHFGAGQTEVKLTLPIGTHTMQLVLADENHVPHDPPVISERIKVTVRPGGPRRR